MTLKQCIEELKELKKDPEAVRLFWSINIGLIAYLLIFSYLPWQGAIGVVLLIMVARVDHESKYHKDD